jgi:hypothetical protein
MNKVLIFTCSLLFLNSCVSPTNEVSLEKRLQNKFKQSLLDVGVKVQDTAYLKGNTLYYEFVNDSGYYVDKATNRLLKGYLLLVHYNDLKELDSINITEKYRDLTDKTTYYFPKSGIDKIYKKLSKNQLFMDLAPYILRNTNANDIIYYDDIINDMKKFLPKERYNFEGIDFWEFIDEYTLNACNPKSEMHKNMSETLRVSKLLKLTTNPDIFDYVIKESERYCEEKR